MHLYTFGGKIFFKGPWLSFKITKVIYLYFEKKIKSSWCVSHGPPSGNPNQPLESLEPEVLPYPLRPAAWRPFLRQAIPLPAGALYLVNTCRLFTASPQSVSLRPLPRVSHRPPPCVGTFHPAPCPWGWGEAARGKFVQQMFMAGFGDWGDWTRSLEVLPQRTVRWGRMGRGYHNGS